MDAERVRVSLDEPSKTKDGERNIKIADMDSVLDCTGFAEPSFAFVKLSIKP
jgi:hypothetical protein